jgi:putative CocE/NonD family hydrolase
MGLKEDCDMSAAIWLMAAVLAGAPAPAATCTATPAAEAPARGPAVPASYRSTRVRIPMRDGVCLDTYILAPADTSRAYPILLERTPYDPAWLRQEPEFLQAGYIFVIQSARGRYGSDGAFVQMRPQHHRKGFVIKFVHGSSPSRNDPETTPADGDDFSHALDTMDRQLRNDLEAGDSDESSDTFDTIDWLVKNTPNNNGRVGLRGISYNGFYAAAGMIHAHPALKAVSPQAPQADWFLGDDTHHNGAFLLASSFTWLMACDRRSTGLRTCRFDFKAPTDDGYQFFLGLGPLSNIERQYFHGDSPEWQVMMSHGTYDTLWQQRSLPRHLRDIKPALLAVSGWYDANNLYGALHIFEAVRHNSPGTSARIALGPWTHGQWADDPGESVGPLHFGSATGTYFVRHIELPFFESYLKGDGHSPLPVASVFDTGRNAWSSFDAWPPKESTRESLYLGPHGSLGIGPPTAKPDATAAAYDEYVSDPAHPVPFVPDHGVDMDADYMSRDQRFSAGRSDVLTYESEVLAADVTVAGPVSPKLVVSTSGTDSDWVVKVIDVHPGDGFQELVRGDVMRAKFRKSFSTPVPMQPNEPTRIDFTMPDVYHTFTKGHRILVRVQSSWFPLVDRNPQQFEDIYTARAADFRPATQRVFHSTRHASRIELSVLPSAH